MKTYHVKFSYAEGGELEPQVRTYRVASVIRAFEKCLKEYPGARLIEGWREGGYLEGYGITVYQPPSLVRSRSRQSQRPEKNR
jgi:hypothetical protein